MTQDKEPLSAEERAKNCCPFHMGYDNPVVAIPIECPSCTKITEEIQAAIDQRDREWSKEFLWAHHWKLVDDSMKGCTPVLPSEVKHFIILVWDKVTNTETERCARVAKRCVAFGEKATDYIAQAILGETP